MPVTECTCGTFLDNGRDANGTVHRCQGCGYVVVAEDNGATYVCRLPMGHSGTHRLIESAQAPA